MAGVHVGVRDGSLRIDCESAAMHESRPLGAADWAVFHQWATEYGQVVGRGSDAAGLLDIGRRAYRWLDGAEGWLKRCRARLLPPLLIEFGVPIEAPEPELGFLEAPWELLADEGGHLAHRTEIAFCPVRRMGNAAEPAGQSDHRLSIVFMAAAPAGQKNLSYEAEESAILRATADTGLDLIVEESGTLPLLKALLAREAATARTDVLHMSCHGGLHPPSLALEDDYGQESSTPAEQLALALAPHAPRLLFLSACHSADPGKLVNSLAPKRCQAPERCQVAFICTRFLVALRHGSAASQDSARDGVSRAQSAGDAAADLRQASRL